MFMEVAFCGPNEPAHHLVAMVARDVIMEISPESLDGVVVWAVGWEEVQPNPPTQLLEESLRLLAVMDLSKIMNSIGIWVLFAQLKEQANEKQAVLPPLLRCIASGSSLV